MLPVIKFPASLVQDVNKFRKDGKFEVNSKGMFEKQAGNFNLADAKSLKSVPLVGELYSNWAGYDKQRRSNKASSLQSDYSEAKRIARVDVEKSGSKQDLKRYRFLTKHNSSVSKITSKINKLKEYERRTGRKKHLISRSLINKETNVFQSYLSNWRKCDGVLYRRSFQELRLNHVSLL